MQTIQPIFQQRPFHGQVSGFSSVKRNGFPVGQPLRMSFKRCEKNTISTKIDSALVDADVGNDEEQLSRSELFVDAIERGESLASELENKIQEKKSAVESLQEEIDTLYSETFSGVTVDDEIFENVNEEEWSRIGKKDRILLQKLLGAVEKQKWQQFQGKIHGLTLTRSRFLQEITKLKEQLQEVQQISEVPPEIQEPLSGEGLGFVEKLPAGQPGNIVLISGFESFNVALYRQAANEIAKNCPGIQISVFSDRDIATRQAEVEEALLNATAFFGSLIFDYDECEWLLSRVKHIPIRLVFESSLELMSVTSLGSFSMAGGKSKGMPGPIKALLSKFGGGKEEDRMVGYLSFLKIGPKLLKFVPGKKVRDLRNWLTIYGYWNQGGLENVQNMFQFIASEYFGATASPPAKVLETPNVGLYHPNHEGYFTSPRDYLVWYNKTQKLPLEAPFLGVLLYRKHVITKQAYLPRLVKFLEKAGIKVVPVFINGVEGHTVVRDWFTSDTEQADRKAGKINIPSLSSSAVKVDAILSTIGFPLVGGPAGTMEGGRQAEIAKSILSSKNVPYIVAAPLLIQDIASWRRSGVQGLQSVVLYSLPELDGAIDALPLGGLVGDGIHLVPERVNRLAGRIKNWVKLRKTPRAEKKIAVILYGFPPGVGATGTAALLNVPSSLKSLLLRMKQEGYNLGDFDEDFEAEDLITLLTELDSDLAVKRGTAGAALAEKRWRDKLAAEGRTAPTSVTAVTETINWRKLRDWIGQVRTKKMEAAWGELAKYTGIRTDFDGDSVVSGVQIGNVWIGVQPPLGLEGDPMRLLFERDLTPHPQYAAFYKWLQTDYSASAIVHFGMHGTVEWLPGSPLGNTELSWSDTLISNLPHLYVYAANNPSESIVSKRRGYGTIISYNVPPYGRAGLYKELASLKVLVAEFREDPDKNFSLRFSIAGVLAQSGLGSDCPFSRDGVDQPLTEETVDRIDPAEFGEYVGRLYDYLNLVENRLFSEGLHTFGSAPNEGQLSQYISAYFDMEAESPFVTAVCSSSSTNKARQRLEALFRSTESQVAPPALVERVEEGMEIKQLLERNTEEMDMLIKGLDGDYILPAVGGDLLRDGPGVLPTGRNIHALDPYRMPSEAAWQRGREIARNILKAHQQEQPGTFPETVAVMLWGLDAIKTRGESVAIAVELVGAYPVKEGTGRVVRFELSPLEELGRPRVDILANMSGIFRDSFSNVVELLDDLFKRAAMADEPPAMNYIRKHALELKSEGVDSASSRIFSNPAGDYGSMVNERIGAADWESGAELGDTWQSRNAFSYGRGEAGVPRPEVLRKLLGSTQRIVQEIDSVEYGLTDIQEYYANTGAMKSAAQAAQGGKKVACSVVETFGKDLTPRDLEATLKLEYRSKLLNPKWAHKMADQGSGGAYEISQRMTALIGWSGTAEFKEDWVYEQATQTYALDPAMAAKLRKNNPQAFQNIVKRMLEAVGRGIWQADEQTVAQLRTLYQEMDSELEGL